MELLIVGLIFILIACIITFIGGILVGLHEYVGTIINLVGLVSIIGWGIVNSLTMLDKTRPVYTYGEDLLITVISIGTIGFGIVTWYLGRLLGEYLKTIRITRQT